MYCRYLSRNTNEINQDALNEETKFTDNFHAMKNQEETKSQFKTSDYKNPVTIKLNEDININDMESQNQVISRKEAEVDYLSPISGKSPQNGFPLMKRSQQIKRNQTFKLSLRPCL